MEKGHHRHNQEEKGYKEYANLAVATVLTGLAQPVIIFAMFWFHIWAGFGTK